MGYIGKIPSAVPLTSADITDNVITSAKIVDSTIVNADIANSTIALAKLSATGTPSSTTFLRGDNSWSAAGGGTPYFSAKGSSGYTVAHNTLTKVQYATELFDSDACYDNATNYRFTPTTAGYYHLGASIIAYKSTNDLTYTQLYIFKNGTGGTQINSASIQRYDNSSAFMYAAGLFVGGFGYANGTTDYFEFFVQAQQVGSGSVSIDAGNTFAFGYKVA